MMVIMTKHEFDRKFLFFRGAQRNTNDRYRVHQSYLLIFSRWHGMDQYLHHETNPTRDTCKTRQKRMIRIKSFTKQITRNKIKWLWFDFVLQITFAVLRMKTSHGCRSLRCSFRIWTSFRLRSLLKLLQWWAWEGRINQSGCHICVDRLILSCPLDVEYANGCLIGV